MPDIVSRLVEDQIMVVCTGHIHMAGHFLQQWRIGAASQRIKVEASPSSDGPRMLLAKTKKCHDAIFCLTRHDPRRNREIGIAHRQANHVAVTELQRAGPLRFPRAEDHGYELARLA